MKAAARFLHLGNGSTVKTVLAVMLGLSLFTIFSMVINELVIGYKEAPRITVSDKGRAIIILPEDPVDVRPVDLCRAAPKVTKSPAPNVDGESYTLLVANQSGTRTWFMRWTDSPAALVSERFVIEATAPSETDPGRTVTLGSLPQADAETIACLRERGKAE